MILHLLRTVVLTFEIDFFDMRFLSLILLLETTLVKTGNT